MKDNLFSTITVEPTNICSLKCPGCPHGSGFFDGQEQGFMSLVNFKKIVDLNPSFEQIKFIGIGEPFLNKEIFDMFLYCSKNQIDVSVHTNGMFINSNLRERFLELATELRITFSLDGVTKESYDNYRVGGDFGKVYRNMLRLLDFKKANNLSNIKIVWQFLLMRGNEYELSLAKKLSAKLGVDEFIVKNIIMTGKVENEKLLPVVKKGTRAKIESNKVNNISAQTHECDYINNASVFVLWDGAVVPCCVDYRREYVMGNAFNKSLKEIWLDKKYVNFRDKYYKNNNELCQKCRFGGDMYV